MKNPHTSKRIKAGVLFAIGFILVTIGISVNGALTIAGLIVASIGFLWYISATQSSRKVCDKCGGSLKGCEYSYQERKSEYGKGYNPSIEVIVVFRAICPNCGAEKVFEKKFRINENSNNLQYQVDAYCRNTFGH
ncbi:MAG: hypothetical protein SO253_06290 [Bacilli bacterium]|nr:hypothetical protein [Bacilli bacterium]